MIFFVSSTEWSGMVNGILPIQYKKKEKKEVPAPDLACILLFPYFFLILYRTIRNRL